MKKAKIGALLLDVLFPRRCVWCDKVIGFTNGCECERILQEVQLPDVPLDLTEKSMEQEYLQQAWACYWYEEPIKGTVWRLKFQKEELLAKPLAAKVAAKAQRCGLAKQFDLVVPVAMFEKARRRRGFNQAALIAKLVAAQTGMAYEGAVLQKVVETPRQVDLSRERRKTNLKEAFAVADAGKIAGKRVLLVDDIITTGSTLSECAKTLLDAGAAVCGALCLANTPPHGMDEE